MQIRGVEKALGTLKITHENPSVDKEYDKNAAALSIDIVKKERRWRWYCCTRHFHQFILRHDREAA
ncbi:hyaluronidase protein HylP domain protein [Streptococcus pyogenes GA06023]|nr:hyaluronidase protein HylP domain protein [Streptococcus pyogenes GA06023]